MKSSLFFSVTPGLVLSLIGLHLAAQGALVDGSQESLLIFDEKCDPKWRKTKQTLKQNIRSHWQDPQCYDFTFTRYCFCMPEDVGPFNVKVRDGVVVEPVGKGIPTMPEIFSMINAKCIAGCNKDKGAVLCNVDYDQQGWVKSLYIDESSFIADEETSFVISDFKVC